MTTSQIDLAFSRRFFFAASAGGVAGLTLTNRKAVASSGDDGSMPGIPYQDPKLVREVVRRSHFDVDGVRDLVKARPELAKSSWDWGYGDWESALGAASHTGQKPIVEVLVAHGARPNLFTYAMLGQLEVVQAIVEANPGIQRIRGPHGITLLQHAEHGGEEASSVKAYLEELGDADLGYINEPLSDDDRNACPGRYAIEGREDVILMVTEKDGTLSVKHGDGFGRPLFHLGNHEFHPVGAPGFRFRFEINNAQAQRMAILDGNAKVMARRIP